MIAQQTGTSPGTTQASGIFALGEPEIVDG